MSFRLPLLLALAVTAAPGAYAGPRVGDIECNVESDYDLSLSDRSVVLTRESGAPRTVVMRQGRLFVDGTWVELTPADRQRVAAFEDGARQAMPEARAIGRDAADIAFTALSGVAEGLASDPRAMQARLDRMRAQLDADLGRSVTATRFDGRDLGDGIGRAVGEMVPLLVGDIVGGALGAVFSGDAGRLKRLETMDAEIEARIKPRAAQLEQRADRLCRRLVELDRLNATFDYRLGGGQPLNLLDASIKRREGGPGAAR